MARPCDGRIVRARPSLDDDAWNKCETESVVRKVAGQELLTGSWLYNMSRENLRLCQKMAPKRPAWGAATLTWGSMCSGSEGPAWVVAALNQLFEEEGSSFKLEHVFSCEFSPEKRKWIHASSVLAEPACAKLATIVESRRVPDLDLESLCKAPDAPCVFFDILEMGAAKADCWEHVPSKCSVPGVNLLIVGTSCKDMSRQNATSARQELVLQAEKSKGGSAQTFQGLMRYVERHRPLMILFENVDAMDDVSLGIAHVHFFIRQE